MNTPMAPVQIRRGWLAVPVLDEETGKLDYWDIHEDAPDWSSSEPLASVPTLAVARQVLREHIRDERRIAALLRLGGM